MTLRARGNYDLGWSRRNVLALIVLCLAAGGLLAGRGATRRIGLGNRLPIDQARVQQATERIDPNTATAASLRRLPGIGPIVAQRIVEYRQAHGGGCFRTPQDLANVARVGPKTVENVLPYLRIEPSRQEGPARAAPPVAASGS